MKIIAVLASLGALVGAGVLIVPRIVFAAIRALDPDDIEEDR